MVCIEDLKVDGGINRGWAGEYSSIFRRFLALSI